MGFKSVSQNICNDSIEVNGNKLFCKTERNNTGKIVKQYFTKKDSALFLVETLFNNQRNGSTIIFYSNSKIMSVQNFDNGITSGSFIKFYSTGILKESGTFLPHSGPKSQIYLDTIRVENVDETGNIIGFFEYEEFNSPKSGVWQYFYETGGIREQGVYLNNKRAGEWKFYNNEGKTLGTAIFLEGKVQSKTGQYYLMK